jgi:hypothetical protein
LSTQATSTRSLFLNLLLVLVSTLCGYVLVEAGYRFHQYRSMLDQIVAAATAQIPRDGLPSSIYDPLTGYRYRPNIEVGPATVPFPVHYKTNSHGLIAREDFPREKPAGEFRIGVVGDSFTANVTSTLRWTDIVEDALNASPDWQVFTGARRTRVINFGLDGIGTVQFGAVVEHIALPFDLDLLVVNMIKDDLIRKPHIRGGQAAISREDISDYVRTHILTELDWLGIYPEVLAVVAGGQLGLSPRLTMEVLEATVEKDLYYAGAAEAVRASTAAFETILEYFPKPLFLLDTTYGEYRGQTPRFADAVFERMSARFPAIEWTNVIVEPRIPRTRSEIDAWFNVPWDQHKNDIGVRIYGEAVAAFLIAQQQPARK